MGRWPHDLHRLATPAIGQSDSATPAGHTFYDPALAVVARIAEALGARMAARQRDYHAEYEARKARAKTRGLTITQARGHGGGVRTATRALRTEAGLRAASPAQLQSREAGFEALRRLRSGEAKSNAEAERQLGLPRGSLRRDFPTAFGSNGKIQKADRELALIKVIGPDGDQVVFTRGSRARSLAGQHRHTVYAVLDGNLPASALNKFRGKKVGGVELECDVDRLAALDELGRVTGGPYPERVTV